MIEGERRRRRRLHETEAKEQLSLLSIINGKGKEHRLYINIRELSSSSPFHAYESRSINVFSPTE